MGDAPISEQPASSVTQQRIGVVTAVSGFKLTCLLQGPAAPSQGNAAYGVAQIGSLIKIPTPNAMAFGFIETLTLHQRATDAAAQRAATAEIDLLGELAVPAPGATPVFSRGISSYPVLGSAAFAATERDLARIYAKPDTSTLSIGVLHQDPEKIAHLRSQEFLSKHSAIVGTIGSGKSCALTLILRELLSAHPNGHVVLLDPHDEYTQAFQGMAEVITPQNLQLPYWLLSYEEIVEVLCSRDPISRSREASILKDCILEAKREFLSTPAPGTPTGSAFLTVDTPTPYRLTTVVQKISQAMGKLDRPDNTLPYLRLMTTIETLRQDKRYAFMFSGLTVRDNMAEILSRILRIPVAGKPITIVGLSAVPSEIVNVLVSLLCRLIFDFAVWNDRGETVPIMLVCDEAHRYIPRDETTGFEPTRRSISRIAKEGRKYGVSLCLVTQRPSEISESILSQCSTLIALRMTNERDQAFVRSTLPESAAGLLNTLPTLRQQEAIIIGEGVAHPMRIRFNTLDPAYLPKGKATSFAEAWGEDRKGLDFVNTIVERWRHQTP
ncbi:MAG: DUF87 domain-containing protein [Aliidongia sp.]